METERIENRASPENVASPQKCHGNIVSDQSFRTLRNMYDGENDLDERALGGLAAKATRHEIVTSKN